MKYITSNTKSTKHIFNRIWKYENSKFGSYCPDKYLNIKASIKNINDNKYTNLIPKTSVSNKFVVVDVNRLNISEPTTYVNSVLSILQSVSFPHLLHIFTLKVDLYVLFSAVSGTLQINV